MTTKRKKYSVFRDQNVNPVLVTEEHSRAIEAMDSMFDRNCGMDYKRPGMVRVECDGEVIEMRRQDDSLKMLESRPAEQHHHAAPYVPSITPPQPSHRRVGPRA